jgi:DNA (cytosine-5)-methyltransferase 1
MLNIIDLFAGAGGLTEGFRSPDYNIIAHVEMDKAACDTLKLRELFYELKRTKQLDQYYNFITGKIEYSELLSYVDENRPSAVINATIGSETIDTIIKQINHSLKEKPVNGIIGGPPCQAYSLVGRKRNEAKKETDERIYLYEYYINFLKYYQPDFFLFENVRGLLSFKDVDGKNLFEKIMDRFEHVSDNLSYRMESKLVDCSEYGVPQARKRLIIFGQKKGSVKKYNFFENLSEMEEPAPTIRELFEDLPSLHSGETHNEYNISDPCNFVKKNIRNLDVPLTQNVARSNRASDLWIYRLAARRRAEGKRFLYTDVPEARRTQKNTKGFLDRFKVVPYDNVSHTVVAHISKDGHYYIHPDIEQNRSITVREAARIQTFPDDFYFMNTRTDAFKQIGNAVPPYIAKKFAKIIAQHQII